MANLIPQRKSRHGIYFVVVIFLILLNKETHARNVTLVWDPSPSANVGGYKLYYGTASGKYSSCVDVGRRTKYKIKYLPNAFTYYFVLKAYDITRSVESASSNEVRQKFRANAGDVTNGGKPGLASAGGSAGLLAAYSFEECSGIIVADRSGNGHTATIENAVRTAKGKFGNGMVFNGVNAKLTVNDNALDLTTGMTLEAWVKPEGIDNSYRDIFVKGDGNYYLTASSTSGARPVSGGRLDNSEADYQAIGKRHLAKRLWNHLATTYDSKMLRLFVNGKLIASQAMNGSLKVSVSPLQVGGDDSYGNYFKGVIDEIRIYNRALTVRELRLDRNTPVTSFNLPQFILGE